MSAPKGLLAGVAVVAPPVGNVLGLLLWPAGAFFGFLTMEASAEVGGFVLSAAGSLLGVAVAQGLNRSPDEEIDAA